MKVRDPVENSSSNSPKTSPVTSVDINFNELSTSVRTQMESISTAPLSREALVSTHTHTPRETLRISDFSDERAHV